MDILGTRLKMARKAAGLSLRKTGELICLSHASIKKYEDGKASPSSNILLKLAQLFGVRTEYFFRPAIAEIGEIKFRKRHTLPKKALEVIQQVIRDQIERRFEVENLFPKSSIVSFEIPKFLPQDVTHLDQIEEIASSVRKQWDLGLSPIHDMVDVLESHGIKVFIIQSNIEDFDGLAATIQKVPIIVVSAGWPGDRQRFTLAHELGHCILDHRLSANVDEEKACNRFAGALLLPKEALIKEIGQNRSSIEMRELLLLKEEYGISMAAICHRIYELKIVNESFFKRMMTAFKKKGWNRKEPGTPTEPEKSHIFEQMVFHALAEDYIGDSKAAELLNLPLDEFRARRFMDNSYADSC